MVRALLQVVGAHTKSLGSLRGGRIPGLASVSAMTRSHRIYMVGFGSASYSPSRTMATTKEDRAARRKRMAALAGIEDEDIKPTKDVSAPPKPKPAKPQPFRYPLNWASEDFYDEEKLDTELRRVFDVCHGCRRCFNLCESFPKLFELIDNSPTGELDSIPSADFKDTVDHCTLCDMCFMVKCPYVPPHTFEIDFPHLMLRYRAVENKNKNMKEATPALLEKATPDPKDVQPLWRDEWDRVRVDDGVDRSLQLKETGFWDEHLTETDRNAALAGVAPSVTRATTNSKVARKVMESVAGVHHHAYLPPFAGKSDTYLERSKTTPVTVNSDAPAAGGKAVIFVSCLVNYNYADIGMAARAVLAHNGITTVDFYDECCGMPQMEQGHVARVSHKAERISSSLRRYIDDGYDIISLTPSCSLMLKSEWKTLLPKDENVLALSSRVFDISEYVVSIAKSKGLAEADRSLAVPVVLHNACHSRAQNMGFKAAELLRLIPKAKLNIVERCSGHGGAWGVKEKYFETAVKVGKPAARQAAKLAKKGKANKVNVSEISDEDVKAFFSSECALAGQHLSQTLTDMGDHAALDSAKHPIELFAGACGLKW